MGGEKEGREFLDLEDRRREKSRAFHRGHHPSPRGEEVSKLSRGESDGVRGRSKSHGFGRVEPGDFQISRVGLGRDSDPRESF